MTCEDCTKRAGCDSPCVYVDRLAGRGDKVGRELIPPPDIQINCSQCAEREDCSGQCDRTDYKQRLTDMQSLKESLSRISISRIRSIHDKHRRAVTAMLHADLTITDIAIIIDRSERTVKRLCGKP